MSPEAQKARSQALSRQMEKLRFKFEKAREEFVNAKCALRDAAVFLPMIEAFGESTDDWKREIDAAMAVATAGQLLVQRAAQDANAVSVKLDAEARDLAKSLAVQPDVPF